MADEKNWGNNPDTWMVVLTALLMLIGIGTAVVFYKQFQEMSRQTGILSDQAKQATVDAGDAAKRAEEELKIAQKQAGALEANVIAVQRSLEVQQRPWVGLNGPIIPDSFQLTPTVSIQAKIPIKNFGHSPALKVMASMEPVRHQELHKHALHVCDLILRFVNGTIPKNQLQGPQIKRGFTLFPDEAFLEPIATGDDTIKSDSVDTLYFLGCVAYRDQFNRSHTTRFCVETPWLAKDFRVGQALASCSVYNEAK